MVATYVKISRHQFENWLFDLCPVFERIDAPAGVYVCPLSPYVAIKISSSLERSNKTDRDADACHMTLISRGTSQVLGNTPGSKHPGHCNCPRTKNWKDNWRGKLKSMFAAFKANREHYNALGKKTQEYAQEWVARIEGIRNYTNFKILRDCRQHVLQGYSLTTSQEETIWKFAHPPRKVRAATVERVRVRTKALTIRDRNALVSALDKLEAAATTAKDSWTIKFASGFLRTRIQEGKIPTERQAKILREKLRQYNVYVPSVATA